MTDTLIAIYLIWFTFQALVGIAFASNGNGGRAIRLIITSPVWPIVYLKAVWRML